MKKEYQAPEIEIVTFLAIDPVLADSENASIQDGVENESHEFTWDSLE